MNARSSDTSTFQVMILADTESLVRPATSFVASIAGDDAHLMAVPFACACGRNGHNESVSAAWKINGGASVEMMAPPDGAAVDAEGAVALAQAHAADLIVMATACSPEGVLDPDCGAAQLALDSPVPVLLVHAHDGTFPAHPPVTRLLVPLDGSARAAQALPFTTRLARRLQLPVQFVMVIDPSRILPPAYAYDPEAMDDVLTDLRETAHWALKQAEQQLVRDGIAVQSVLLYGPVTTCIQSAIEPGDLVIMTTHGTGRSPADHLGSVAARMVANVTSPLVIMRGRRQGDVVVEGYVACPWVEPLSGRSVSVNA